ncbi:MAG: VOC family protein [Alphaproteobacteria bacterium]
MSKMLFNYSSVVVDNLAASGQCYEAIGLKRVWEGVHPIFDVRGAAFATQKGGALLLERSGDGHPALRSFEGAKERNFHIALLVDDLAAQLELCRRSNYSRFVSDIYRGIGGASFAVELNIGEKASLWLEFTEGLGNLLSAKETPFECVDSTAMAAAKRSDIMLPFESIGLRANASASDGFFDVLSAINAVVMLDWHYLEVNEPTDEKGVMAGFLKRIGRPGIFGTNLVPVDMAAFVERAKRNKVDTNTEEPIRLMVEVRGKQMTCADIITINPRATGGARIFILKPLEYPWQVAV